MRKRVDVDKTLNYAVMYECLLQRLRKQVAV